ncbi:pentatricopeptide repeat-containing protein At4g31070, mitochondrial [Coffea eugenioides]|uniref:pentatricopeptide repeat-containing protein At4g31070, mitochondrial n=1 Tax=Coffea eugenioides TaxID=49369 RepID=UPI000F60698E|nr:pentatricopeptide repeat-containing protein At4g31070, mitochondrial [Coffea eugenioides]
MHQIIRRFTSASASASGPITSSIAVAHAQIKDFLAKGLYDKAINLFKDHVHPFFPNHESSVFILPSIVKATASSQTHNPLGLQLHCYAFKNGFDSESTVSNSLISMYAKFSDTKSAYKMFDTMPQRDTISWNSMINCYMQNGFLLESMKMFKDMYICGFEPKPELIASVLSACSQTENFRLGRLIHAIVIVDERFDKSVFMSTALVDFYWRCHDQETAFRVFDRMEVRNEVSWTAMITGCVADHDYAKALDCFRAMQVEKVKPNRVTVISILPACAEYGSVNCGTEIHGYAFRHEFDRDFRFCSALIHMYCECGEIWAAKLIFERSTTKDVVMWSCIIAGYSRKKETAEEALELFNEMQKKGFQPNSVTLLSVISACTNLLSTCHAGGVHGYVLKSCLISELNIQNSLSSMYAKCGCLQDSVKIFKEMTLTDSVSWTAIISAYGLYGCGEDALQLFGEMQESGMKADAIALLEVMTACNHAGLVEEGYKLFNETMKDEKISLTIEHYACYIDLLGRAGKLEDACDLVSRLPMKPSPRIWSSLVSSCKLHGKLEVAELLVHKLIESEPENAANYTLLSMIYAESGNWHGVEEMRKNVKIRKLVKTCAFSKI